MLVISREMLLVIAFNCAMFVFLFILDTSQALKHLRPVGIAMIYCVCVGITSKTLKVINKLTWTQQTTTFNSDASGYLLAVRISADFLLYSDSFDVTCSLSLYFFATTSTHLRHIDLGIFEIHYLTYKCGPNNGKISILQHI